MHVYAGKQLQAVSKFNAITDLHVSVLEIIEIHRPEVDKRILILPQLIHHTAGIDAVAIAHRESECSQTMRSIEEIKVGTPIQLLLRKVVTGFGTKAQHTVIIERPVIIELLLVRKSLAMAIAHHTQIQDRRKTDAPQYLGLPLPCLFRPGIKRFYFVSPAPEWLLEIRPGFFVFLSALPCSADEEYHYGVNLQPADEHDEGQAEL